MHRWITAAAIASLALSGCSREDGAAVSPETGAVSSEHAAELYARHCALCHGERGDGQGPRHGSLFRKPRDFRDPVWREGRTAAQVRAAIRDGIPGTDMPSWRRLDDAEIAALADHVLAFGARRP